MYEIRDVFGNFLDSFKHPEYAAKSLKNYTTTDNVPTMIYVDDVPKYILTYTATEHHESYPVGTIKQDAYKQYTLEGAREKLREERKHWEESYLTRSNQGEGFEIWTVGLREVK